MQQSSMVLFCDECGLANDPAISNCAACQHLLTSASSVTGPDTPVALPITIIPRPVLEVTPAASMQSASSDLAPGTILAGRYQIHKEIGRGGFSVVYQAIDLQTGRHPVAIKRIHLAALTPRQIIDATETFNREVTMLPRFKDTQGVPRFYEHLTDPENWYLVMEYINGQTLEDYLTQKRNGYMKERKVIELGMRLASILQELHKDNPPVIFRDVKPSNIMLTPRGKFYLIDFGIARNFTFGKAKDTTPLGSPGYAPPEQYGRAQTERQADIYSLGATLQTLLTGRDPLELASGEPSRNPKAISPGLRKLLDDMLAPDVARRPLDMINVQLRLEKMQRFPLVSYSLYSRLRSDVVNAIYNIIYSYLQGILMGTILDIFMLLLLLPNSKDGMTTLLYFIAVFGFMAILLVLRFSIRKWLHQRLADWRSALLPQLLGFTTILIVFLVLLPLLLGRPLW